MLLMKYNEFENNMLCCVAQDHMPYYMPYYGL